MRKKLILAIPAIALVFAMTVLEACSSSPAAAPVVPDDQSAVVYFFGSKNDGANVWDGETPIGDFAEGPFIGNLAWKTTPGEHYFMVNTFNWVAMRADLQANKAYYIKLETIPNPVPFSKDFVAMRIMEPTAGEAWVKQAKAFSFTDEWRAKYAQGKRFQQLKEHLQKARNDKSMEITLR